MFSIIIELENKEVDRFLCAWYLSELHCFLLMTIDFLICLFSVQFWNGFVIVVMTFSTQNDYLLSLYEIVLLSKIDTVKPSLQIKFHCLLFSLYSIKDVLSFVWILFRFSLKLRYFFYTSPVAFWIFWRLMETLALSGSLFEEQVLLY